MQQNEYSMTNTPDVIDNTKPYFTLRWLGMRTGLVIALALCATILAVIINEVAFTRKSNGFLSAERLSTIGDSISYAFIIVLITLMSTTLVEVIFRKPVNAIQYSLSACAMSLFYLLLTSFSELMPFGLSYLLSCIMILGMLTIYLLSLIHI